MISSNRVVVTGMGIVSPCGIGLDAYWDSLINCKSGIGPITLFDTEGFPLKIAGEVKNFDLRDHLIGNCKPHRLARQTKLGLAACQMAIDDAKICEYLFQLNVPIPIVLGISSSCVDVIEQVKEIVMTRGASRVRPYMAGACQPFSIGAAIAQYFKFQSSITTISAACPSGLDAVATATQKIRNGSTDIAIVGAADSPLNIPTMAAFVKAGLPSLTDVFPPEAVSRPFDAKRSGVVLSEGAGFLVLERLDSALARGVDPIAEIAGGSTVTDTPEGGNMSGLLFAMHSALANSGVGPEQVDYICANATSDKAGDAMETQLIKQVFGARARSIPISSIRGVMGHGLSPAGISQVIACALSMKKNVIVPTANLTDPDDECDLDYVPLQPRHGTINVALANAHGLGGENSALVIKRFL